MSLSQGERRDWRAVCRLWERGHEFTLTLYARGCRELVTVPLRPIEKVRACRVWHAKILDLDAAVIGASVQSHQPLIEWIDWPPFQLFPGDRLFFTYRLYPSGYGESTVKTWLPPGERPDWCC